MRVIGHFVCFFYANEASVYRALLAFIFSEKIFKGGTKSVVKNLKTLANTGEIGFYFCRQNFSRLPLFKQRGINYPPTFVGFETKFCFKCLPILNVVYMAGRSALKLRNRYYLKNFAMDFQKGAV